MRLVNYSYTRSESRISEGLGGGSRQCTRRVTSHTFWSAPFSRTFLPQLPHYLFVFASYDCIFLTLATVERQHLPPPQTLLSCPVQKGHGVGEEGSVGRNMWEVHHKTKVVEIEDVHREGAGRYDIQMDEEEIEVFHMEVVHKEDTQLPYYY